MSLNSSRAVKSANKASSARLAAVVSTAYEVLARVYPIQVLHSKGLKVSQKNAIWKLLETNMYDLQKNSSMGWDPKEKRKELFHSLARFILVTESTSSELVAFTHFRFESEDDENIVYCYELQVAASAQGMGLGKRLVQELEKLCSSFKMEKITLTVLKANSKALTFYERIGFQVDPTSPDFIEEGEELSSDVEDADYQILSKIVSQFETNN